MRCSRCGRRGSIRRAARSPDGKLVFDWCSLCHHEVNLRALGIKVSSRLPAEGPTRIELVSPELSRLVRRRSRALVVIVFLFGIWGASVCAVGLAQGLSSQSIDVATSPLGLLRSRLLTTGGAVIVVLASTIALGTVAPSERRSLLLRLLRAGFGALGLAVLVIAAFGVWPGTRLQLSGVVMGAFGIGWAAHVIEGRMRVLGSDPPDWLAVIDLLQPKIKND